MMASLVGVAALPRQANTDIGDTRDSRVSSLVAPIYMKRSKYKLQGSEYKLPVLTYWDVRVAMVINVRRYNRDKVYEGSATPTSGCV